MGPRPSPFLGSVLTSIAEYFEEDGFLVRRVFSSCSIGAVGCLTVWLGFCWLSFCLWAWFHRLASSLIWCDLRASWSSVGLCLAELAWELLVLAVRACLHPDCHLSGGLVPHRCLSSQVNNFLWSSNFGPMSPFDQYSAVWFWIHSSYRPQKKDDLAAAWTLGVYIPQRCPSLAWRSGWRRGSTGYRSEK